MLPSLSITWVLWTGLWLTASLILRSVSLTPTHCSGLNLEDWLWLNKSSVSVYMQDACWSWCNLISIDHQLGPLACLGQCWDLILTHLSFQCLGCALYSNWTSCTSISLYWNQSCKYHIKVSVWCLRDCSGSTKTKSGCGVLLHPLQYIQETEVSFPGQRKEKGVEREKKSGLSVRPVQNPWVWLLRTAAWEIRK